ncbi:hypothetical protein [Aquipseudomonas alcaligenes]|uniref:hypothetical protein n=1 Tax=Aquipseudomonas alcaligenes TaxID=43263 RepID=UPI0036462D53
MELSNITFAGPAIEESSPLEEVLPMNLLELLRQVNGFIQYGGGLHVRGICSKPEWHSLALAMQGPNALYLSYPELSPTDIPFAQDCMADQFILRDGVVFRLESETGNLECLRLSLSNFLERAQEEPIEFLSMHPLLQYQSENQSYLEPGKVLHAYPPYCTAEAENGVHLAAVPIADAIAYLAQLSSCLRNLDEGEAFDIKIINSPSG